MGSVVYASFSRKVPLILVLPSNGADRTISGKSRPKPMSTAVPGAKPINRHLPFPSKRTFIRHVQLAESSGAWQRYRFQFAHSTEQRRCSKIVKTRHQLDGQPRGVDSAGCCCYAFKSLEPYSESGFPSVINNGVLCFSFTRNTPFTQSYSQKHKP